MLYLSGFFWISWKTATTPLEISLWVFVAWILFNFVSDYRPMIFRVKGLFVDVSLRPAVTLATLFLFGILAALWVNVAGSLMVYLVRHRSLARWGITAGIEIAGYTVINSLWPWLGAENRPFQELILPVFLFCFFLLLLVIFLGNILHSLEQRMSLKRVFLIEWREFRYIDLLQLVLYPVLALLLIALWPVYPWAIPILGIPFYGLKLVMENAKRIPQELEKTLQAMADVLEAKDMLTSRHTDRVGQYAAIIAKHYGLSEPEIDKVAKIGRLHDIGKIVVPDEVLQKTGKLSREEFEQIKLHVQYDLITPFIPPQFPIFQLLRLSRLHHERFDGKGYPFGLRGESIPLEARIVAVADAWDAMTSPRVYRGEIPLERALEILKENSGTQWDPKVVDAFMRAYTEGTLRAMTAEHKIVQLLEGVRASDAGGVRTVLSKYRSWLDQRGPEAT